MCINVCICVYVCFVACSCVMVNESWEAQRQENLGGVAILTWKSCDTFWRKVTDKSNHLSAGSLRSVPQESWSLTASSGKANEQRNPEHVVLDLFSNFTKWVGSTGFFWWTSGRLQIHKVSDSRQSGRPHDQSHESSEIDQVRTSVEFARSILHRLEPTCTVTSVTSITETLSVEMNSFSASQTRSIRENLRTTTMKTGIDTSPQPSTSNSIDVSAKMQTVEHIAKMCLYGTTTRMPRCGKPSRMTLHRGRVRAMTSLSWANGIASPDAKLTAANARKGRQTTASLRPSWWKWRTRWNVPFLSSQSLVVRDVKGVSMVSVAQCVVLTALYTSCSLLHEWHPCWHHIISSLSQFLCLHARLHLQSHLHEWPRSTNITTMLTW